MDVTLHLQIGDSNDTRLKDRLQHERCAIRTYPVNALIQGTSWFVAAILGAVRRDLDRPEFVWPDMPTDGHTKSATVLVLEVGALPPRALDSLANLIACSHTRVQVIATSSVALYELVEHGRFPVELYYRLNVISLTDETLELRDAAPASWRATGSPCQKLGRNPIDGTSSRTRAVW